MMKHIFVARREFGFWSVINTAIVDADGGIVAVATRDTKESAERLAAKLNAEAVAK